MQPGEDWWTFDTCHMAVSDVQVDTFAMPALLHHSDCMFVLSVLQRISFLSGFVVVHTMIQCLLQPCCLDGKFHIHLCMLSSEQHGA